MQLTVVAQPCALHGLASTTRLWGGRRADLPNPPPPQVAAASDPGLGQVPQPPHAASSLRAPFVLQPACAPSFLTVPDVASRTLSQDSTAGAPAPPLDRAPGILLQDSPGGSQSDATHRPARVFHGLPPEVGRMLSAADKLAAHEPPPPESAFVISNGKLRLPVASFDTLKEDKLSFDEWCGASDNLVEAMRKHLRGTNRIPVVMWPMSLPICLRATSSI
ncbi:hypothetical protein C0992_002439 [Termitomyces sp. T32_za158]|nr:hypothetical protein C0992_002439 [Termitomyces sp. T32_za158]